MTHDVWVEVDISALKHNFQQVKGILAPQVKIVAVVKGNGFGHGFVEPSRAFVEAGADMLAVTRLDEAMILRNGGISAPILLFAPIQPENAGQAIEAGLHMTGSEISLLQSISDAASKMGRTAQVHIKIDTGMGRLGAWPPRPSLCLKPPMRCRASRSPVSTLTSRPRRNRTSPKHRPS